MNMRSGASGAITPSFWRSGLRFFGLLLSLACVIAPALPFGPALAQPPVPLGALWAAYGWAADGEDGWRAPAALGAMGLLQDQLAGGPLGFYMLIYLSAFLIARVAAGMMRTANLISPWMGFAATAAGACLAAMLVGKGVLGGDMAAGPFLIAAGITALLFPLVRPLYMGKSLTTSVAIQKFGR